MCCHVKPKKVLKPDGCLHDSTYSENESIGSYQSENIWTVFLCLMLSLWCWWAQPAPLFQSGLCLLSFASPSPRSSAPPLMNSSAHLLASTSTLTPTTGAILMEKRSLSKHEEAHRIDLSTSAPLSTPSSESRPICISTQYQRILQPPAPHSLSPTMTHCQQPMGGSKTALLGAPTACHHIVHYIQEWSCGHAWMISVFKNEGMKLRAIDLFTSQTDTVLLPKPPLLRWSPTVNMSSVMW